METAQSSRPFRFELDAFTFANELVWLYQLDPATGKMVSSRNPQPPQYTHRCFVLVRAARQFFYHARFDPALPKREPEIYRELVRQVVARDPRRVCPDGQRLVFPGYESLRAFSRANEALLKAECGQAWQSYLLRSHWRMIFPVWGWHQEWMARKLQRRVLGNFAPAVHLFRFPQLTINHGIVLYAVAGTDQELRFTAYDPNDPETPATLIFERARRRFYFPPARYWAGGPLSVMEIFWGLLF